MVLLYVIYHDQESLDEARQMIKEDWGGRAIMLKVGLDKYFENQFWPLCNKLAAEANWENEDFVGLISYKYTRKTKSSLKNISDACRESADADVIALYDYDVNLMEHACQVHGDSFRETWKTLLQGILDDNDRDDLPAFFCNFWLAKPDIMKLYAEFAVLMMGRMEKNYIMMNRNSRYRGRLNAEQLVALTGNDFYTLHPFIMERLPCLYLYHKNYKIGRLRHPRKPWKIWTPLTNAEINCLTETFRTRLALFATHSIADQIEKNTVHYIKELAQNYDNVIVISTQHTIYNKDELPANCRLVQTDNACHDFGLHFRVLFNIDTDKYGRNRTV